MISFFAAFVLSLLLVGLSIPGLRKVQLMDIPNYRSSHEVPIPRSGGVALMIVIPLPLLFNDDFGLWPVVVFGLLLAAVGLIDDLVSMPGTVRLGLQMVGAAAVCMWLLPMERIGSGLYLLVAALVMVAFINAFNFMDGVNGISALTASLVGAFWAFVGSRQDLGSITLLGLVLAGAGLGFLPWNAPRARVFLGDVGSYGLGATIGALSVVAWSKGVHPLVAVAPMVIYGADTGWVLVKRAWGRRPLLQAHREHVYQRLVDSGWSHVKAALLCASFLLLVCATATLMWHRFPNLGLVAVTVSALLYLATPRLVTREPRSTK